MAARIAKPRSGINKVDASIEHIGHCVVCKLGIFSNETWGRAPLPLLGKAHTTCGGA
jgi:hypothetical protein